MHSSDSAQGRNKFCQCTLRFQQLLWCAYCLLPVLQIIAVVLPQHIQSARRCFTSSTIYWEESPFYSVCRKVSRKVDRFIPPTCVLNNLECMILLKEFWPECKEVIAASLATCQPLNTASELGHTRNFPLSMCRACPTYWRTSVRRHLKNFWLLCATWVNCLFTVCFEMKMGVYPVLHLAPSAAKYLGCFGAPE